MAEYVDADAGKRKRTMCPVGEILDTIQGDPRQRGNGLGAQIPSHRADSNDGEPMHTRAHDNPWSPVPCLSIKTIKKLK
jgi:hypothetical protein